MTILSQNICLLRRMYKSYIITGATGIIGVWLTQILLENNCTVALILNPNSPRNFVFSDKKGLKLYYSKISNLKYLKVKERYEVFVHLAWTGGSKRNDWQINKESFEYSIDAVLLAASCGCVKFIGAGSQAECGPQNSPINENTLCNPVTAFGISKLCSYYATSFHSRLCSMNFCWLRIISVYGPFDRPDSLVSSTIYNILHDIPLAYTKANYLWDFLYVKDAASLIYRIISRTETQGTYIIAHGKSEKLKFRIQTILDFMGYNGETPFGKLKDKDTSYSIIADGRRNFEELEWHPCFSFTKGIKETINYIRLSQHSN